ncbi:hypothetical protein BDV28DRAFT_122314 [Aspergillus coremiiformis]|uniref:Uncharacterized protein n=1 Tax=Aspergillus coremiiformis TaxID=138285 RepID=A0A5N6Z7G8_9EURO|nr:hypothetical protein BDV28DRAFT_122314 [Aspergillus coremiiformis]
MDPTLLPRNSIFRPKRRHRCVNTSASHPSPRTTYFAAGGFLNSEPIHEDKPILMNTTRDRKLRDNIQGITKPAIR